MSEVQHKFIGFSSATYLVQMNAGTAISSIMRYRLDIANALNVPNVRIMKDLYIHEGKAYRRNLHKETVWLHIDDLVTPLLLIHVEGAAI